MNDKVVKLEQELYESKSISIELLEKLKDLEFQLSDSHIQIQTLQSRIAELLHKISLLEKNQAIYIAHKGDMIDSALGKFINKYPERE